MVRASLESCHSVVTTHQSPVTSRPRHHPATTLLTWQLSDKSYTSTCTCLCPSLPPHSIQFNSTCLRHRHIISDIFPIKVREEHYEKLLSCEQLWQIFCPSACHLLASFFGSCLVHSLFYPFRGWLAELFPTIHYVSLSFSFFFKKNKFNLQNGNVSSSFYGSYMCKLIFLSIIIYKS